MKRDQENTTVKRDEVFLAVIILNKKNRNMCWYQADVSFLVKTQIRIFKYD